VEVAGRAHVVEDRQRTEEPDVLEGTRDAEPHDAVDPEAAEVAAAAVGLNPTRYKIVAFVVAAFFAGVAGGLYAHFKLTITPTGFDFTRSIEIVVMVILGGMGNAVGVILAAVLLTLLPELLRPIAEYRMIIYSLLLVLLMLLRPQGLFRLPERRARG